MHDRRSMVPPTRHAIWAIIPHHWGTHGTHTKAVHPAACTCRHSRLSCFTLDLVPSPLGTCGSSDALSIFSVQALGLGGSLTPPAHRDWPVVEKTQLH